MNIAHKLYLALFSCMAACASGMRTTPAAAPDPIPPAVVAVARAGVADAALGNLLVAHWDRAMRNNPTWATELGDHRFDDKLPARDSKSLAAQKAEVRSFLAQAEALSPTTMQPADKITLALFAGELQAAVAVESCQTELWSLSSGSDSVLGELSYLVELHPRATASDGENLLARLAEAPTLIASTLDNLSKGLAQGFVAPAESARRAVEQLDRELALPVEQWAMTKPARSPDPGWATGEYAGFSTALISVVKNRIAPELQKLRAFIHDEILPHGRSGKNEGLAALPDGNRCYQADILTHLGAATPPADLHELGLREIARTDAELAALGAKVLGTPDLPATISQLRSDPALRFTSADEIIATAESALARARAAVPKAFSVLPVTPCVVSVIPDYEAPFSTIAYYREPQPDGAKPGEFFVNTYEPTTRPRYEFEALTWHESIPGHHLQIALAQELGDLPAFRKYSQATAFVEGWALYTERLADELGLYSSDLDRLGMVSYDAWRSARLVVDTGLHSMGWTRAQAEAFMLEHTALTPGNISNEVDRYITWPGQALGYKVGQLTIMSLRAEAEAALGDKFDLRRFHEVVLGAGAVTLPVLSARVHELIIGK